MARHATESQDRTFAVLRRGFRARLARCFRLIPLVCRELPLYTLFIFIFFFPPQVHVGVFAPIVVSYNEAALWGSDPRIS